MFVQLSICNASLLCNIYCSDLSILVIVYYLLSDGTTINKNIICYGKVDVMELQHKNATVLSMVLSDGTTVNKRILLCVNMLSTFVWCIMAHLH